MIPLSKVQISNVGMLHEIMTRHDYVLPELKCRWTTLQKLLDVRDGRVWALRAPNIVYK